MILLGFQDEIGKIMLKRVGRGGVEIHLFFILSVFFWFQVNQLRMRDS